MWLRRFKSCIQVVAIRKRRLFANHRALADVAATSANRVAPTIFKATTAGPMAFAFAAIAFPIIVIGRVIIATVMTVRARACSRAQNAKDRKSVV